MNFSWGRLLQPFSYVGSAFLTFLVSKLVYTAWLSPQVSSLPLKKAIEKSESLIFILVCMAFPLLTLSLSRAIHRLFGSHKNSSANQEKNSENNQSAPLHTVLRIISNAGLYVLLPMVLFLTATRVDFSSDIKLMDDGIRLAATHHIMNGQTPYKDIYFNYGPLMEFVQPWIGIKLFGDNSGSFRWMEWWAAGWGWVGIIILALVTLKSNWSFLAFLVLVSGQYYFYVSARAAFPLFTLAIFIFALDESRPQLKSLAIFGAGILTGLSYLYSMEGGILTGGAIVLYAAILLVQRLKNKQGLEFNLPLCYMAGVLVSFLPLLLIYGPLQFPWEAMKNSRFFVEVLKSEYGKAMPPVWPALQKALLHPWIVGSPAGTDVFRWAPVAILLIGLTQSLNELLFGMHKRDTRVLLLLSLFGLAYFNIALGRSDFEHWLKATPTLWLYCLFYGLYLWKDIYRLLKDGALAKTEVFFRVGILTIGGLAIGFYSISRFYPWTVLSTVEGLRVTLPPKPTMGTHVPRLDTQGISPEQKLYIEAVVKRINQHAGDDRNAYLFTDQAAFYYFANILNPTRYTLPSWLATESSRQEVLNDLALKRPRLTVVEFRPDEHPHLSYLAPIYDFIRTHYRTVDRYENLEFMLLGSDLDIGH